MTNKDVENKVPIYKLKTTEEIMKYYEEWGKNNKYDKDMVDWNYTGPKETVNTFTKYAKWKMDYKIKRNYRRRSQRFSTSLTNIIESSK